MPDHYTRLLEWRREEAATRGLHKLPSDFYSTTEAYLADTRATFEAEVRANPGGRKGDLARQTYVRATQVARDIVEARMMKVLTLAFQAGVGSGREVGNALPPERQLFDRLVDGLRAHRLQVAPYLGPVSTSSPGVVPPDPVAPQMPETAATKAVEPSSAGVALVRVLKDGKPIEVSGAKVEIRQGDLLTLPEDVARILVDARVAERVVAATVPTP